MKKKINVKILFIKKYFNQYILMLNAIIAIDIISILLKFIIDRLNI